MNNYQQKLLNPTSVDHMLYWRLGEACLDPIATIAAVHDFESFKLFWRSTHNCSARTDRMKKLYNLYLAVSKNESAISRDQFLFLKNITPGYEKVSMTFFLNDIKLLVDSGIIILKTPTIKSLRQQEENDMAMKILEEKVVLAAKAETAQNAPTKRSSRSSKR